MKLFATIALLCAFAFGQTESGNNTHLAIRPGAQDANEQHIAKEVRHELLMLPYYSIFDDLEFSVNNGQVTLLGSVVDPVLKKDAENSVKRIEGVTGVNNQIKVLPPSPNDDQIRRQEFRAIANQGSLYRYFMGAVGSIHIIVDNGHVTLKGVVDNQADDTQAKMAANQVPGVFSVTDNLIVANQSKR
ncbi:MAG: BON domain-containing protein [Acidobacteria bacterium]|nr:BON domain-containing protein [Acidobacteriota bacterium]MBV9144467.1 BON domain-containing protein [Acidobacteriota bacterium]MBV9436897.1 BON domain-containing protein [Acidobacteriota bacterium]